MPPLTNEPEELGGAPEGFMNVVRQHVAELRPEESIHRAIRAIAESGVESRVGTTRMMEMFQEPEITGQLARDLCEVIHGVVSADVPGIPPESLDPQLIADVCRAVTSYFYEHLDQGAFGSYLASVYQSFPPEKRGDFAALVSSAQFQDILCRTFLTFARAIFDAEFTRILADKNTRTEYFGHFVRALCDRKFEDEYFWTDLFEDAIRHGIKPEEIVRLAVNYSGPELIRTTTHSQITGKKSGTEIDDERIIDFFSRCLGRARTRSVFQDEDRSPPLTDETLPPPFDLLAGARFAVTSQDRRRAKFHAQDYVQDTLNSPEFLDTANAVMYHSRLNGSKVEPRLAAHVLKMNSESALSEV